MNSGTSYSSTKTDLVNQMKTKTFNKTIRPITPNITQTNSRQPHLSNNPIKPQPII